LGVAYRDMGLVNEAIDEFRQAADDPEAAVSAHYHIALCEIDLGQHDQALSTFQELLSMDGVTAEVRAQVQQKMADLEAQAS
jgi:pilus assembly protein FimV